MHRLYQVGSGWLFVCFTAVRNGGWLEQNRRQECEREKINLEPLYVEDKWMSSSVWGQLSKRCTVHTRGRDRDRDEGWIVTEE